MITFFGVMAAMFLSALDQTIVSTAMPRIAGELHGLDRYTWVTTVYLLTSTAVVPVVGKISEQLGRKRVFLTGIVLFLAGSALCGAAQDLNMLIAFRAFQGIGGGVLTGTAFAVIADLFSPAERGRYTGMMVGVFGLASIVGPLAGGYLTDNASWRWVFYVNLPIGAVVLALLAVTFPALRHHVGKLDIDFRGAFGLAIGSALAVLGLSLAGNEGWSNPMVWLFTAAGVLLVIGTMFEERYIAQAVLPPVLLRSSIFSISLFVTFLIGIIMFGAIIYVTLFLQAVVGVKATNSGLLLIPLMAGMVFASVVGGFVLSNTGRYKIQSMLGFVLMGIGMYLLTKLTVSSTQLEVARDMVLIGLGMGTSMPVYNVISQNAVDTVYMSSATSALAYVRTMGGTVGLAVLGAIFTQSLKTHRASDIPATALANVPGRLRAALDNPASLGDALRSAGAQLQAQHNAAGLHALQQVVGGFREALTHASVDIFAIGTGAVAIALIATFFLREIPLRKTSAIQDRLARAEASAAATPSGAAA